MVTGGHNLLQSDNVILCLLVNYQSIVSCITKFIGTVYFLISYTLLSVLMTSCGLVVSYRRFGGKYDDRLRLLS
jgi:hypothetical protein